MLDADGPDREESISDLDMQAVTPRQLVWADLVAPTQDELDDVAERFCLPVEVVRWLALHDDQPRAALHQRYVRLRAIAVEPSPDGPFMRPLGIVAGWRYVLTVHPEPLDLLGQLDAWLAADATIGQLDAAMFLAAILNSVVTGYFVATDSLEDRVAEVDDDLLGGAPGDLALTRLVELRHVATDLRRAITAHREVFGSLAWADFEAIAETHAAGRFQLVADRFDRAVDAIENARDQVVGAFDIHLARTAQRTNDIVKILTIVSAVLLPGSLVAALLGMNVATPLPTDDVGVFWVILAAIGVFATIVLAVARRAAWL
ncbi:MAG TPA: CorA family divalent cation transporter [Candidatus Limnocylindrales bacterium]|nr:CorA family divalent cation transporter [Candidatus Limnocylindrales bacterium]